ncbi:hypothetical protein ABZP36_025520 [Zizania latifolia]
MFPKVVARECNFFFLFTNIMKHNCSPRLVAGAYHMRLSKPICTYGLGSSPRLKACECSCRHGRARLEREREREAVGVRGPGAQHAAVDKDGARGGGAGRGERADEGVVAEGGQLVSRAYDAPAAVPAAAAAGCGLRLRGIGRTARSYRGDWAVIWSVSRGNFVRRSRLADGLLPPLSQARGRSPQFMLCL